MLSDPSMRLMALEGIERILAIGETKIHRNPRMDSLLLNPNPYASLLSVEAVESLHATTKSTSLGKRVSKLYKDHFVACTICRKSFHKNTTVLKFCEECKGPVCLNCNCSVYHLSYQEEVWELIESMEVQAKRAQKKKKKQKTKTKAAKKAPAPHPNEITPPEDPKVVEAESPADTVLQATPEVESEVKSKGKTHQIPQVCALGNGAVSIIAPDSSEDLELLNDESFIAVSRHRKKNGKEKQEKERKEKAKPTPASSSSLTSSAKKPIVNSKPSSNPAANPTVSKSRAPPMILSVPLGETRSHPSVSRYADAVLQPTTASSSSSIMSSRLAEPLSATPRVDDFPPLSSSVTQLTKKAEKTNPLLPSTSPPSSTHLFHSSPPLRTPETFSHFSNSPHPEGLSHLLSSSPTNGSIPASVSNRSLSDLFMAPVLLNPPTDVPLGNGSSLYSPPLASSSLFSPTGLSGDVDIEDGDLHMRRAEMLLGDDDDDHDLLNTSRETEDLVEFLQETGSIAALAERLGFRSK